MARKYIEQRKVERAEDKSPDYVSFFAGKVKKYIEDEGADINRRFSFGYTPLQTAIITNTPELVDELLSRHAEVSIPTLDGETALSLAAKYGSLYIVKKLIETKQIEVHKEMNVLTDLYHIAAFGGFKDTLEYLLQIGVPVNAKDSNGISALHFSAKFFCTDQENAVKLLLDKGANINISSNFGETPLHAASKHKQFQMVNLLLDYGACVDAQNNKGETALHISARKGKLSIVRKLLSEQASINITTYDGKTALHYASLYGKDRTVEYLIKEGALIDARNNCGFTPLHYSAEEGHLGVVKMLMSHNAMINPRTVHGDTPLQCAATNGHEEIKRYLIAQGALVKAPLDNST